MNETRNETGIVVVSPDALATIIRNEVNRAITELSEVVSYAVKPPKYSTDTDILTIDEAIEFLKGHGLPIRKGHIYNLVTNGRIPYRKRGRYLNFSKHELLAWLDSRTSEGVIQSSPTLQIAKSAIRKK